MLVVSDEGKLYTGNFVVEWKKNGCVSPSLPQLSRREKIICRFLSSGRGHSTTTIQVNLHYLVVGESFLHPFKTEGFRKPLFIAYFYRLWLKVKRVILSYHGRSITIDTKSEGDIGCLGSPSFSPS